MSNSEATSENDPENQDSSPMSVDSYGWELPLNRPFIALGFHDPNSDLHEENDYIKPKLHRGMTESNPIIIKRGTYVLVLHFQKDPPIRKDELPDGKTKRKYEHEQWHFREGLATFTPEDNKIPIRVVLGGPDANLQNGEPGYLVEQTQKTIALLGLFKLCLGKFELMLVGNVHDIFITDDGFGMLPVDKFPRGNLKYYIQVED